MTKLSFLILLLFFVSISLLIQTALGEEHSSGNPVAVGAPPEEGGLPPGWFPYQKGPIRVRSQFPLTLPFLAFLPDEQMFLPEGGLLVETTLSFSNTFARTFDLESGRTKGERTPFTEADFDRVIADNPGKDQFFLDLETSRLAFLFTYGLTKNLQINVEVPFLHIGGGVMDGLVQNFHDNLSLGQSGRTTVPRGDTTLALFLDGNKLFLSGFSFSGLGDVVITARFPLVQGKGLLPRMSGRVAAKLPTGDYRKLLGSGHADYGIDLDTAFLYKTGCLHINLGVVFPGKWKLVPGLDPKPIYSILFAWEIVPSGNKNVSYLIQDLAKTSPFRDSTDTELSELSHEISFGMKIDIRKSIRLTLALTENHSGFNNSSDIGFHLGLLFFWGALL